MYEQKKEDNYKRILIDATLFSGAPYENSLSDGIIAISEDTEMAKNPYRFKKDEEADFSDEEMFELHDIVNRI